MTVKSSLSSAEDFLAECEAQDGTDFLGECATQEIGRAESFFWDCLYVKEPDFFADCISDEAAKKAEAHRKHEAKMERIDANRPLAERYRRRLLKVQAWDVWKHAEIGPDWDFDRYDHIKALYRKRDKLAWILKSLYEYYAFDYNRWGIVKAQYTYTKLGKRYESNWRKYYKRREEAEEAQPKDAVQALKDTKVKAHMDAIKDIQEITQINMEVEEF